MLKEPFSEKGLDFLSSSLRPALSVGASGPFAAFVGVEVQPSQDGDSFLGFFGRILGIDNRLGTRLTRFNLDHLQPSRKFFYQSEERVENRISEVLSLIFCEGIKEDCSCRHHLCFSGRRRMRLLNWLIACGKF